MIVEIRGKINESLNGIKKYQQH